MSKIMLFCVLCFSKMAFAVLPTAGECMAKIDSYAEGLVKLDGFDSVKGCGSYAENCLHPLEQQESDSDGNVTYVATYEFGGAYPNFHVYFITVDQWCGITKVIYMRH